MKTLLVFALLCAPSFGASPKWKWARVASTVAACAAHGADEYTTHVALTSGHFHEGNALMRHGGVRVSIKAGLCGLSIVGPIVWRNDRAWTWVNAVQAGGVGYVAVRNNSLLNAVR